MQSHYTYSTLDYRAMHGDELRRAHDEWDTYGTGPRALFEEREAREQEFRRMIAPGGSLSELAFLA